MLNNLYVIPVHGVHWKAMEEEVESLTTMSDDGTELSLTLRESVMLYTHQGQRVFNGVESTTRVDTEGRWIFVTTKENKQKAIEFLDTEFKQYYRHTAAHKKYQNAFAKYPHPTRIQTFQTPAKYVQDLKIHTAPTTMKPTQNPPRKPTVVMSNQQFPPLVQPWSNPDKINRVKATSNSNTDQHLPSQQIQQLQQQLKQSSQKIQQLTTDQQALTTALTEMTTQISDIHKQLQTMHAAIETLTAAVKTLTSNIPVSSPASKSEYSRSNPTIEPASQQLTLPRMMDSMKDAPRSPRSPAGNHPKKAKLSIQKRITQIVSGTQES